ncbi:hypothetical protein GCM10023148_41380 [Actinokineospora soli]
MRWKFWKADPSATPDPHAASSAPGAAQGHASGSGPGGAAADQAGAAQKSEAKRS